MANSINKRVLGIDPGFAIVGYGAIDCQYSSGSHIPTVVVGDYGVITTSPDMPYGDRLKIIYDDIRTLLKMIQPAEVVMEKFFFNKMANTIQVAQARGVLMLAIIEYGITPLEVGPNDVKMSLTGYGKAKKPEIQEAVTRELKLLEIPRPDDAADALAIAVTGAYVV